jgi:dienelactone hydrolase
MQFRLFSAATSFILFFLCGTAAAQTNLFEYDRSKPVKVEVINTETEDGLIIEDVEWSVTATQKADALAVRPEKPRKPAPLVVLQHWGGGTKEDFRADAIAFAKKGFHAVSIDAPWLWPTVDTSLNRLRNYPDDIINSVKAIRQLVDWYYGLKGSPKKVYYVGHSYGATLGGLLVGVEPRIRAAVLMAGLASVSNSMIDDPKGFWERDKTERKALFDSVTQRLALMEPELYINRSKARIFHQAASNDQLLTRQQSERYIKATRNLDKVQWYPTDHIFKNDSALNDRVKWIVRMEGKVKGKR